MVRAEAEVSTHLAEPETLPPGVLAPAPDRPLFTVGPFEVVRGLVRAPGAWLVEGRDSVGRALLLQLVHLRAVEDGVDQLERIHFEQTILAETSELLDEAQEILAHGAVDRPEGRRVLYWAVPMPTDADRVGRPLAHLEGLDHLLRVAIEVGRIVAARHERGRTEPLLSEPLFLVGEQTRLLGVPVYVDPAWLAADMPPPRIAPEESTDGTRPTPLGDVWRFGQALSALACAFEPLPEPFHRTLDRLTATEPRQRTRSLTEAIGALTALREKLDPTKDLNSGACTVALTAAMSEGALSELVARSMGDRTRLEIPGSVDGPRVPPWAFFFEPEEYRFFTETLEGAGLNLSDEEQAEAARLCRAEAPEVWAEVLQRFAGRGSTLEMPGLEAAATIVEAPMDLAAFVEDLEDPIVDAPQLFAEAPLVFESPYFEEESTPVPIPPAPELHPEPPRPARKTPWSLMILGALGLLALLGIVLLAIRMPAQAERPTLPLNRTVTLDSNTEGAIFIGEDGTQLGAGPLTIAHRDAKMTVFLTAKGHRPEKLTLPSGGMITVDLRPLDDESESCEADLPPHTGVEIVDENAELLEETVSIQEATVLQVTQGDHHAALLVTCAGPAIAAPPRPVVVVEAPGTIIVDEEETERAEVRTGFHQVGPDGDQIWVAIDRSIVIEDGPETP